MDTVTRTEAVKQFYSYYKRQQVKELNRHSTQKIKTLWVKKHFTSHPMTMQQIFRFLNHGVFSDNCYVTMFTESTDSFSSIYIWWADCPSHICQKFENLECFIDSKIWINIEQWHTFHLCYQGDIWQSAMTLVTN
jgi:hypothetical protein